MMKILNLNSKTLKIRKTFNMLNSDLKDSLNCFLIGNQWHIKKVSKFISAKH